ncbi:MAG: hypothetical protein GWP03_05440 [Proteobacteria bacterium]|nr:hypothetical protein [Pseudomonadota bacterium]
MGIAKMTKVYVAFTSRSRRDIFSILQDEGLLHISRIKGEESEEIKKHIDEERKNQIQFLNQNISRINTAIDYVSKLNGAHLTKGKFVVSEEEYARIAKRKFPESVVERVERHTERISHLGNEIKSLNREIDFYMPWKKLKVAAEEIKSTKNTMFFIGMIPERNLGMLDNLAYEIVNKEKGKVYLLFVAHKDSAEEIKSELNNLEFEHVDFDSTKGHISHVIEEFERRKLMDEQEIRKIHEEDKKLVGEIRTLYIFLDYYENEIRKLEEEEKLLATNRTFVISGWVETERFPVLGGKLEARDDATIIKTEIGKEDNPPIKLKNNPLFRPFEILTKLYGMPYYYELDPSPLMSLFFAAFFGLCLTDAGYGIVLSGIILFYMLRTKTYNNKLLNLLFIGGLFTFVEGWFLHGWFGDLFTNYFHMSIPYWFDPLKNPMAFVSLALSLGIVQILVGITIGFIEKIRSKDYLDAFTVPFAWFMLLTSILAIVFATNTIVSFGFASKALLPAGIVPIAEIIILIASVDIILFSNRHEKNWGFRIFLGILNLTIISGLTSYLGDLLSYIRLVALGLVTAGIAVAINKIAFMTLSIPVIGIVFTVIILVGGHLFNIAINSLGGFVHSLRLQYVEYFSKFFIGGGIPFSPLKRETKHILIK